jgi:hypothetical protein
MFFPYQSLQFSQTEAIFCRLSISTMSFRKKRSLGPICQLCNGSGVHQYKENHCTNTQCKMGKVQEVCDWCNGRWYHLDYRCNGCNSTGHAWKDCAACNGGEKFVSVSQPCVCQKGRNFKNGGGGNPPPYTKR